MFLENVDGLHLLYCVLACISLLDAVFDMLQSSLFLKLPFKQCGPRQANLSLIAYASSEGSGEPAHPRSLARTSAARSYRQ